MNDTDLIGRERDLDALWGTLADRSVLLTGPRRVGKTALLQDMVSRPRHGWRCIRVDVEGDSTAEEAVNSIRRALATGGLLRRLAGRVESVEVLGVGATLGPVVPSEPWVALAQLLEAALADSEDLLIVAIDELPWWLDGVAKASGHEAARTALAQLRRLRQHDRLGARLRFVYTGSVGLAGLAQDLGASAEINDLALQDLRPLTPEAGRALFETATVSRDLQASTAACEAAHNVAGGLPHWIKELAHRARPASGKCLEAADVERAVDEMLQIRMRSLFEDEGREHLQRRHADEAETMTAILSGASEGTVSEEALITAGLAEAAGKDRRWVQERLYRLADEYYLEKVDGNWRFMVPLFQRWWQRYGGT